MRNFEYELPAGFQQVYEIDASDIKTVVVLNVVGLAMTVLAVALLVAAILPETYMKLAAAVLFGFHFGGCVGDLYVTYLILFKIKGNFLMKDTGPKQTFYSDVQ